MRTTLVFLTAFLLALPACQGSGTFELPGDDDDSSPDPGDDDDLGDDDDDDDDSTPEPFDCATAPNAPLSEEVISGPRGYHGLAIDQGGNMVGSDGSSLIKSSRGGDWWVFLPSGDSFQQMIYLSDGDLVASSGDGDLKRITPQGGMSVMTPGVWAYGVILGPDGNIYTAGDGEISRINPATGERVSAATWDVGSEPHSLSFNLDYTRLYVGTIGDGVFEIEIDQTLSGVGSPTLFSGAGDGWQDGVAFDACGVMYVPEYWSKRLYRIYPDGSSDVFADWTGDPSGYGHGVVWGNGIDGFRTDALYLPLPYSGNQVKEIVVGVPSRDFVGTVVNAPTR